MPFRSGKTHSRGVQFGATAFTKNFEDDDSDDLPIENKEEENTGVSWNLRMRHLASPLVDRRQDFLDPVISTIVVVILTRCTDALSVIRKTNGFPFVDLNLEYVPVNEKYENLDYYELETINDQSLLASNKFKKDLSWIEKVLKTATENLRRSWSFESFLKVVNDYQLMKEDEDQLLSSKKFNQNELLKLRTCAEAERDFLVKSIQQVTEKLGNSKDELNDGIMEHGIKTRFLKNWENARYEQNKMILTNKENSYLDTTRKMVIQIEREKRVHEELTTFMTESLEDYQEDIEKMMEKYDTDLDKYEIKIGKLRLEVDEKKERYNMLLEEFNQHKQLIEEYKEEKLRKQKEKEEEDKHINAATKIQSWWRGIMFRKGLGPFRRKKGKGKHGGSGSGKKHKK